MIQWMMRVLSTEMILLCFVLIVLTITASVYIILRVFFKSCLITTGAPFVSDSTRFTTAFTAFVLAFVIVSLWQTRNNLEQMIISEARTIHQLEYFTNELPTNQAALIKTGIEKYVDLLIHDEWPLMATGKSSSNASEALWQLEEVAKTLDASTPINQLNRQKVVKDITDITLARDNRLDHLNGLVPGFMVWIVVVSMFGCIVMLCLLENAQKTAHRIYLGIVSTIMGMALSLVVILNYPFEGEAALKPTVLSEPLLQHDVK